MKKLFAFVLLACVSALSWGQAASAPDGGIVRRPVGFYVLGTKLYDPSGAEFRIRGVNHNHLDNGSPGIPNSGANTVRLVLDYTSLALNWSVVHDQVLANGMVPIPGQWAGTCKSDPALLASMVQTWVDQASTWTKLNANGIINIANEWGPPDSTVWRDSYIAAVQSMRAAGYTGTLLIDSGGCGQDPNDIVKYGAAVLAADPLQNILFDLHVYGNLVLNPPKSWMTDYTKSMVALKASGLPIILGEFGPGLNVGPSPTLITPVDVIATAEDNGWGWMAWAWDDNNLKDCKSDDMGFSMTRNCGVYTTDDDLTTFGRVIVATLRFTHAQPAHGL